MQDWEIFSSRVPENLAPSSLGVSVHARKRFPDLALGAMKNPLYHSLRVIAWPGRPHRASIFRSISITRSSTAGRFSSVDAKSQSDDIFSQPSICCPPVLPASAALLSFPASAVLLSSRHLPSSCPSRGPGSPETGPAGRLSSLPGARPQLGSAPRRSVRSSTSRRVVPARSADGADKT